MLFRFLQNKFQIEYSIIFNFDNFKKILSELISDFDEIINSIPTEPTVNYDYDYFPTINNHIYSWEIPDVKVYGCSTYYHMNGCPWEIPDVKGCPWEIPDVKVNDNFKKNKSYNKLDMRKIKCIEFKRVQTKPNFNKRAFVKHLR
jgi:hypothetical protein